MRKKIYTIFALAFGLCGVAAAQAQKGSEAAPSWTKTPSRYLGKSENDYVQAMKARLAIAGRDVGPFGRQQDPNKEPEQIVFKPKGPTKKKRTTPFAEVVASIQISTISMAEKSFYVGGRKFRLGQEFPIEVGKEKFRARIDAVNSKSIAFTELKSGEHVVKRLDIFPTGISRGGGDFFVPGVTRPDDGQALKLNLEAPRHSN